MPIYKIANINIKTNPRSQYLTTLLKDYETDENNFDFTVTVTENDIINEKEIAPNFPDFLYESSATLRKISKEIFNNYNGVLFHSVAIEYRGKAYIFTAKSGTGKTTHIMLWKKCLGDKVKIINGDKPFIRFINDKSIVFGCPWQGKENLGENTSCELGGIFFLQRAKENSVETLPKEKSLFPLLNACDFPKNSIGKIKAMDFIEKLTKNIPVFLLKCNMDDDACYTALSAIGEENEN